MRAGDGVTERALARLERYVMLETPSGDGDRIRALIRVIADDLQALGAEVEVLDAGEAGANLHARISGAEPALEPLLPCARFQGFLVKPPNQILSYANAPKESFAQCTAPASVNFVYT